jgi:hypothetical protein
VVGQHVRRQQVVRDEAVHPGLQTGRA